MVKPIKKCPECGSEKIEEINDKSGIWLFCNKCGFDERYSEDVFPEEKTSQKQKGRYSVYKKGGGARTRQKGK